MTEGTPDIGSSGASPRAPRPGAPGRTSAEIRRDIDLQQAQLADSVVALRSKVNDLTDWRAQISEHREQLIRGAAVAGFVVGTVIAFRAFRRRR